MDVRYGYHARLNKSRYAHTIFRLTALASEDGAPPVASLRTIKSDVVVDVPQDVSDRLDAEEPGWRISGKYVSLFVLSTCLPPHWLMSMHHVFFERDRLLSSFRMVSHFTFLGQLSSSFH